MDWYAIYVKTGKEDYVKDWLHFCFDSSTLYPVVPKRKLSEKRCGKIFHIEKNVFPGYVLINTKMSNEIYYTLKNIPNFIKLLSDEKYLSKIHEEELNPILKLLGNDHMIGYSKVLFEGTKVLIVEGPLVGMDGIIRKINKHTKRAKVDLNFMGELRSFDVGIEILQNT